MKVRIGRELGDAAVNVDTTSTDLLVLVGDPGAGKTTLARHLARWWLADRSRTASAFVEEPHQYSDLPMQVRALGDAATALPAADPDTLTILDGGDRVDELTLRRLIHAPGFTIVTSYGEAARALDPEARQCLGLLPWDSEIRGRSPVAGCTGYDPAQGRLDWPCDVVATIPDMLGTRDVPVHRWQVGPPPVDWRAV